MTKTPNFHYSKDELYRLYRWCDWRTKRATKLRKKRRMSQQQVLNLPLMDCKGGWTERTLRDWFSINNLSFTDYKNTLTGRYVGYTKHGQMVFLMHDVVNYLKEQTHPDNFIYYLYPM